MAGRKKLRGGRKGNARGKRRNLAPPPADVSPSQDRQASALDASASAPTDNNQPTAQRRSKRLAPPPAIASPSQDHRGPDPDASASAWTDCAAPTTPPAAVGLCDAPVSSSKDIQAAARETLATESGNTSVGEQPGLSGDLEDHPAWAFFIQRAIRPHSADAIDPPSTFMLGGYAVKPARVEALLAAMGPTCKFVRITSNYLGDLPVKDNAAHLDVCRQMFESVTPNYAEHLADPTTRQYLIAAYLWDNLIAKVLNKPSAAWAGVAGKVFERMCQDMREHIETDKYLRPEIKVRALARLRESSARFAVEISQRLLYNNHDDVPPRFVEMFELEDEGYRLGQEIVDELGQVVDIADPERFTREIQHIVRKTGLLKGLFMQQREEFKVVMAGRIEDLSARHDIDIPKESKKINEGMCMLGIEMVGITKIDFVVHPLIMRYGDVQDDLDPLLRTIENPPVLVWHPWVLCQQHGKRRREWDAMSEEDKIASWKDADAERSRRNQEGFGERIREAKLYFGKKGPLDSASMA